jgi:hypothetical protein
MWAGLFDAAGKSAQKTFCASSRQKFCIGITGAVKTSAEPGCHPYHLLDRGDN